MSNNTIEDIKINSIRKETNNYRIKSYVVFLIGLGIIALIFLFLGSFGNDLFGLLIFLLLFLIPVIILFRNKIPSLLPDFISESIFEIDDEPAGTPVYNISEAHKQYAMIFGFAVLIIGAIFLIIDYRKKIEDPMSVYKIYGSVICCVFASFLLTELTGEELTIFEGEEEDSDESDVSDE